MPRIGHLEVKIKVEDTYPPEFDDDDDEAEVSESVTTKYIEAVSGAKFGIKCKVLPSYHFNEDFLSFQIFLDGQRAGGKHFLKEKHDNRRGEAALVAHAFMYGEDDAKSLKFRFANLETREALPGEVVEDMREEYESLGTISVQVWRKQDFGRRAKTTGTGVKTIGGIDAVPEKALKGRALSLATSLEPDGNVRQQHQVVMSKPLDDLPVATFNFKYRSRKALQSLLILPRSPSPGPIEERPVDQLTPKELRQLVARQRDQLVAVKQEGERKPIIKRERPLSATPASYRPTKVSRSADGKLIYHLDSDDDDGKPDTNTGNAVTKDKAGADVVDLLE